jgi:hypothetical protein
MARAAQFRLRPSVASKFARGMALVHGRHELADAAAATLSPEDTLEKAARTVMAKQLGRLRRYDPDTRLGGVRPAACAWRPASASRSAYSARHQQAAFLRRGSAAGAGAVRDFGVS